MSDTQDQLLLRQRHRQQRQILAMMGIEQWVQPHSPTLNMANIPLAEAAVSADMNAPVTAAINTPVNSLIDDLQPSTAQQPVTSDLSAHDNKVSLDLATIPHNAPAIDDYQSAVSSSSDSLSEQVDVQQPADTQETPPAVSQLIEPLVDEFAAAETADSQLTVAPFDLQAGRYGDWVLMVDIQALTNDSQKLWQNITQALSLSCETSSFPICVGMDTAELANASLAGYIFKIGRSEDIQVAALTALPDGLEHPNLVSVPTLNEMLADSSRKRQLWQRLS